MMQVVKNKKVWFFFVLGIMILTTVCLYQAGSSEKEAFVNGRIVQHEEKGTVVRLPFKSCSTDGDREAGARA
ncbi:MAG: hypothetical protein HFH70_00695 [Lachnospiraceae bacterium]|nr:hypothetical protein [Lachnospiraceae bacterium]